jgi:hypothetical protein
MAKKTSSIKKTILGIGIALLLVLFWGYSVHTFYERPESDDFCKDTKPMIEVDYCEDYDEEVIHPEFRGPVPVPGGKGCYCYEVDKEGNKKCETANPEYTKCWESYDVSREKHEKNSFIVLVILGLLSIFVGGVLLKVEAVSSGIMGGGVLTLLYAALRFWGSLPDYGRLLILGVALATLIWLGYKKFKH